jgi:hypothetical protein
LVLVEGFPILYANRPAAATAGELLLSGYGEAKVANAKTAPQARIIPRDGLAIAFKPS